MSQCWHRSRTRKNAFTLVELLVVISVIGILTSLLIPAVNMARGSARKAACTSNLRQMVRACSREASVTTENYALVLWIGIVTALSRRSVGSPIS